MTTDPLTTARALIEPLTGYTSGPWAVGRDLTIGPNGCGVAVIVAANTSQAAPTDARLIAAAPDLRDMVATLADALEAERAEAEKWREAAGAHHVAAMKEAEKWIAVSVERDGLREELAKTLIQTGDLKIALADAQAALDKLPAKARAEGWRAGREAATEPLTSLAAVLRKSENSYHQSQASAMLERVAAIRALPEPKEASHV